MEAIDTAHERWKALAAEILAYATPVKTEADTRLKVINRVLIEILEWTLDDIETEETAGRGFVDYKVSIRGNARLILEAKRDGADFGLSTRAAGRAYRLSGPVFGAQPIKLGIQQAITYSAFKSAELGCITNGNEWMIFRANRLGDGRDVLQGMAFVFPSLTAIDANFGLFYDLLSKTAVESFTYRAHFQEAEGRRIRRSTFRRALVPSGTQRLLRQGRFSADLDRIMTSFFRRISGDEDQDLLLDCFVVTRESHAADERLARVAEDLVGRIREVETDKAALLVEVVDRVRSTHRNEFVLLVGTKGAGKSTFIDRFFTHVLPKHLVSNCVLLRVNLADNEGDESQVVDWLTQHLRIELESAVFNGAELSYEDIQGMFYDEYTRWRRASLRHLYESDREKFKIEFGRHIETLRESHPTDYIARLLSHIVRVRKKLPCLVFDNADHFTIEFQERVFQYARSLYERQLCLVILPITDRTSWHMAREGALRSFENEALFLPTPSPRKILERRISYFAKKIEEERRQSGRGYFLGRGINLTIDDLTKFAAALQSLFLRAGMVARWIGNLANRDVRQCLELAKTVATSPHIQIEQLFKGYVIGSDLAIPRRHISSAMIKVRHDVFVQAENRFVHNVFGLPPEVSSTPLLSVRLLQLLRDARRTGTSNEAFVTLDQTIEYFRAMQIDPSAVMGSLEPLLNKGLCWTYDPTVTSVNSADRIELSPSGFQHLWWATKDYDYVLAMAEITDVDDEATYEEMKDLNSSPRNRSWKKLLQAFTAYLVVADRQHCTVPEHDAYANQNKVAQLIERIAPKDKAERERREYKKRELERNGQSFPKSCMYVFRYRHNLGFFEWRNLVHGPLIGLLRLLDFTGTVTPCPTISCF